MPGFRPRAKLRTLVSRPAPRHRPWRALPKIYSRELVDLLLEQPYCRISNVVDAGIVERQTASRYLKELVAIGVLDEVAAGRERPFINRRFFNVLTHDSNSTAPFG